MTVAVELAAIAAAALASMLPSVSWLISDCEKWLITDST